MSEPMSDVQMPVKAPAATILVAQCKPTLSKATAKGALKSISEYLCRKSGK